MGGVGGPGNISSNSNFENFLMAFFSILKSPEKLKPFTLEVRFLFGHRRGGVSASSQLTLTS